MVLAGMNASMHGMQDTGVFRAKAIMKLYDGAQVSTAWNTLD